MTNESSAQAELEWIADTIEKLQAATHMSVGMRGLTGAEFHPLVVLDLNLFNLLVIAKLAAGTLGKERANTD